MATIIRDYREGELIPDDRNNYGAERTLYTFEELDGGILVDSDDITGAETYRLKDGRTVRLQSVDLDWVGEDGNAVLLTTSAPYLYQQKGN